MKKITLLFAALVAFVTADVQGQVFAVCGGGAYHFNASGGITIDASVLAAGSGAVSPQTISTYTFPDYGNNNLHFFDCATTTLPANPTDPFDVRVLVTGSLGDTASCIAQVALRDTIRPIARCQNISVNLDGGTQSVTVQAAAVNNNSTDNCRIKYLINNATSQTYTTANLGVNNVTLTVRDSFANTSTCAAVITVLAATSINETAALHNISIAPNPFSNDLRLDFSASEALSENTIVSIFGLDGKRIATREIAAGTSIYALQMPELAAGMYILQLQNSKFRISEKIMKF
jgi:hypothetical protein